MVNHKARTKLSSLLHSKEEQHKIRSISTSPPKEEDDDYQKSINDALRAFGVLAPHPTATNGPSHTEQKVWRRTMPSSLLSLPTCAPSTTLVKLSSLTHTHPAVIKHQQEHDHNKKNDDALVEVSISSLLPPLEDGIENNTANNTTSRRPLAGNLSSKLTEYTRGQVGRRKPFKAGGMNVDENAAALLEATKITSGEYVEDGKGEEKEEEYMTQQDLENARDVVQKQSAIDSWNDGTLLTCPPGVTFSVGIGPKDVYQTNNDDDNNDILAPKGGDVMDIEDEVEEEKESGNDTYAGGGGGGGERPQTTMWDKSWDKSYFDDDSLFGDSSSESSSDGSDDDDDESEDEDDNNDEDLVKSENKNEHEETTPKDEEMEGKDEDAIATAADDVDALLAELTQTTDSPLNQSLSKRPKKSKQLKASSKEKDAHQPRKSWAVTTPLPLQNFHSIIPNMAITYPFELDEFQKQAVARLERSECIFVAAHTSAGKTVCAEYAIALARKHCTRAIYTSPIKALSNQKYRDFKVKFGDDVGLITGDMQIGADSSCLIMTTEILRSMLYRGADLVRDIEWVIFDEVHYINDTERGVVWEEVIIMLPDYVNLIFLSATTPNTIEFSDWIGRTKRKPVHVIRTDYRPVPLSHHLYAGNKLHKVMEGKSGFLEPGYNAAAKALLPTSAASDQQKPGATKGPYGGAGSKQQPAASYKQTTGSKQLAWQQQGNRQNWTSLVKYLEREGLVPTVIFSFSKKKCEEIANMLRTLDLNTASERNAAHQFGIQTRARLSPNDASLPQVITICEMVKRGIGVHHGGLLPILKEMVEILFSRNLIKVLFATETFAMGVNMPARAVVFNSIRKHDGKEFRVLQPGEYTQMAGRAGRRGLDKVGTVIMCCFGDTPPPQLVLRNMLTGSSTKLASQFRLTYNMILNLLRVEDMSVEGMIKRSFSEFATQRALTTNEYPKLLSRGIKTLSKLDEQFKLEADSRIGADDVEDYYAACRELLSLNNEMLTYILNSAGSTAGGALVPGRVLLVTSARKHGYVRAPALMLRPPVLSGSNSSGIGNSKGAPAVCMVLLPESYVPLKEDDEQVSKSTPKPGHLNFVGASKSRHYAIREIHLDGFLLVSSNKQKIDVKSFFKEGSQAGSAGKGLSAFNDPFSRAKPMGGRRPDEFDDAFAAFAPRGKKGASSDFPTKKTSSGVSKDAQLVDQVISLLIETEAKEAKSSLGVMDLRDCIKGVQQGNDALEFRSACDRLEGQTTIMRQFASHYHPSLETHYAVVERKETLRDRVGTLRHLLSNESLQLFPDFLQRKALLRTLGYVDENDTVCVKGRVACEVNTCEELIVTEMVFEGILNELEPAEIVAALSSLIFQEKSDSNELDSELPERLHSCCERMQTIALNLGQLQSNHGLPLDPVDYCDSSLKFGLVHVVYEWAMGVPFSNICELTLVQEGSIVRCITRLDELCREVRNCARVVGNPTLYRKMESASVSIKRDIVFASSLYIS